MIFEATNREEVIIRMDLYEANAFVQTGTWNLLHDREALIRAIRETESLATAPSQLPACDAREEDPRNLVGGETDADLSSDLLSALRESLRWKELP